MAAETFLVGRYEVHTNEPLDKRQLSVLKDSTNQARKVLVALSAMETSILGHFAMMLTTIRTYNVLLITNAPTTFNDGLLALFVRSEIRCE
jgi:hypothetical protein